MGMSILFQHFRDYLRRIGEVMHEGLLLGLTRYANSGHIARAALEATAYQTKEVMDAMQADSGVTLTSLKVDGGNGS